MKLLTALRVERGYSMSELARRSRVNSVTIGWVESGRFQPYTAQLQKLAAALEFPGNPSHLLTEVDLGKLATSAE